MSRVVSRPPWYNGWAMKAAAVLLEILKTCLAHEGPSLVDVAIDRGFKAMT